MRTPAALLALALLVACGDPAVPDAGLDGMDGGFDAGRDGGSDAGLDASIDAGVDAGPLDAAAWVGPGCDPDRGVECDGDWAGRCAEPCAADECCSPQLGELVCVPRNEDGSCPAADIWFDAERTRDRYDFGWRDFADADCAIAEACVDATGWRRLLRFPTWTPNTGTADLYLGNPEAMSGLFLYSECHDHYHFDSYARFDLRDATGAVVARGHKQATCLLDTATYPDVETRGALYTCDNQGIQRGWQDVYFEWLDCQWIDVTDVEPGDYLLHVELNYDRLLLESDYDNNVVEVPITVFPDDVTHECPGDIVPGLARNCGWERAGAYTCTPGARVEVGCSATCGVGECTGNPMLRVCEGAHDPDCDAAFQLGANDDSYCDEELCTLGGDCCPRLELDCPASGALAVFSGPYFPGGETTCDVVVREP